MSDDRSGRDETEYRRREFIAGAEEILEALSDGLRELESFYAAGRPHLDVVHTVFRQVHSLKGIAALLGFPDVTSLAHALEDLLSRLRLGAPLDGTVLDLLHDTLDDLLGTVNDLKAGASRPRDLGAIGDRLRRAAASIVTPDESGLEGIDLPEAIRASLSEHEERRLRACRAQGLRLSLVRLRADPQNLQERLEEAARWIAPSGELIGTVPLAGGGEGEGIAFELLVASREPMAQSRRAPAHVEEIREIAAPASSGTADGTAAPPAAPGAAGPDPAGVESLAGPSGTLRVGVARLDEVLAQVGDLSIAVASLERSVREVRDRHPDDRLVRALDPKLRSVLNRLRTLQRGAIEARLVPLEQVFRTLGRLVARNARAARKEVDLHTLGAETELDKSVMDAVAPLLMHLVANSLDHGIEGPEERERLAKPRRGRLVLSAFRRGPAAVIDVIDDGRGIDLETVRAAASARGLWEAGRGMTRQEAHEMIFRPGFSTAARVSEVSGRGVGMDVVRRSVRRLKGTVEVRSVEGQGTTVTLTVPISLALVPAIIVQALGQRFAIPIASVRENVRLDPARLRRGDGVEIYDRAEGPLPLLRLDRWLLPAGPRAAGGRYAVIAGEEGRTIGIVVDALLGRQDVVVKPVGRLLRDLPGVAGATDLGDAEAVLVLDPETLAAGDRDARAAS